MTKEKAKMIANLVSGMRFAEWVRLKNAIDKKFDAEIAKTNLTDTASIERMIIQECCEF